MFRSAEKPPSDPKKMVFPNSKFDCQNKHHLLLIEHQIARFNDSLLALQTCDQQILNGLFIGTASWFATYIFPLITVSIIGFCYSTHFATKRCELHNNYVEALNNLYETYNWCLGEKSADHFYELRNENIQKLIQALSPWISIDLMIRWNEQDLKPGILGIHALTTEFQRMLDNIQSGQQIQGWKYNLYSKKAVETMENFSIAEMSMHGVQQINLMITQTGLNYRAK